VRRAATGIGFGLAVWLLIAVVFFPLTAVLIAAGPLGWAYLATTFAVYTLIGLRSADKDFPQEIDPINRKKEQ
jgi:hypothetical protein